MALYVAVEQPLPADLPGWLVEPCLYSPLPVFVEVGVQDHSIAAGGHGCLLPCNTWRTRSLTRWNNAAFCVERGLRVDPSGRKQPN